MKSGNTKVEGTLNMENQNILQENLQVMCKVRF